MLYLAPGAAGTNNEFELLLSNYEYWDPMHRRSAFRRVVLYEP
jgi:hypothetical protein